MTKKSQSFIMGAMFTGAAESCREREKCLVDSVFNSYVRDWADEMNEGSYEKMRW